MPGRLLASLAAACLLAGASAAPPRDARIVAVGDVHGDATTFAAILRHAGLIDGRGRWTGGRAVLVQTGDYLDRGPDVRRVVDLLMALEKDARKAGGQAIVLLGNHEAMNAMGDLRYVAPAAFASFADTRSERRRESAWRAHVKLAERRSRALQEAGEEGVPIPDVYRPPAREAWMLSHPLGHLEYLEAFAAGGQYGKWIRRHPVIAKVGGTVFLHGGLDPEIGFKKLEDANDRAREELTYFDRLRHVMERDGLALPSFTFTELIEAARAELARVAAESPDDPQAAARHHLFGVTTVGGWSIVAANGPVWFRGFATWTEEEGTPLVDRLQQQYGPVRFVVGHTQTEDRQIAARFGGRIFLIDTALSSAYDDGRPSALEIEGGHVAALTLEDRRVLVGGGSGD